MNKSPSPLSKILNHPHFWLWLGAGIFAISLSAFWKPGLKSFEVREIETVEQRPPALPVLSAERVPQQPQLYPFRLSKRTDSQDEAKGNVVSASRVVHPLQNNSPSETKDSIVHADWETETLRRLNRVRQVSVSYVESEPTAAAWFTGTIEAADAAPPEQDAPQQAVQTAVAEPISERYQGPPLKTDSASTDSPLPVIIPAVARPRN